MGGTESSCSWRQQRCLPEGFPRHCCDEDDTYSFPPTSVHIGNIGLRIFHFNDVYVLDNLPKVKAHIEALGRLAGAANVVTTLSGDFVAPSMLSAIDHGAGMVACLNDLPVDYCCFGNHESDIPYESLLCRIAEFGGKWINSNMQAFAVPAELEGKLPEYCVVEPLRSVHGRTVALLGLNVATRSLYRQGAFNGAAEEMESVADCALRMVEKIKADIPDVDCIIPLTHQDLKDDIALAETGLFPVILGGHDHFVHNSLVRECRIVKAGEDAKNIFQIDLTWDELAPTGSTPTVVAELIPLVQQKGMDCPIREHIHPDANMTALVEHRMLPVVELQAATLASFKDRSPPLSSKGARAGPNSMGTLLATALRDATRADAGVINAGSVRGNRDYPDGLFTFAHLSAEVPFPSANIVIQVDGRTLCEAVRISREGWVNNPGSEVGSALHTDEDMSVDPSTGEVLTVAKLTLNPTRIYNLVVDAYIVRKNPALKAYAAEYPDRIPPDDAGQPAMPCLVKYFCRLAWQKLASSGNSSEKCEVTEADIEELVRMADTSGDEYIDFEELLVVLEQSLGAEMSSRVLARQMMNLADLDNKGKASVSDLCLILQESIITQMVEEVPTEKRERGRSTIRSSCVAPFIAPTDSLLPMMPGRLSRVGYLPSIGPGPSQQLLAHHMLQHEDDHGHAIGQLDSMKPMLVPGRLSASINPQMSLNPSAVGRSRSPRPSHLNMLQSLQIDHIQSMGPRAKRQSMQLGVAAMSLEEGSQDKVVSTAVNFAKNASKLAIASKRGKLN